MHSNMDGVRGGDAISDMPQMTSSFASNPLRPTWIEVDQSAIAENFSALRETAAPARVMPVIKADAYGHGAVDVARHLVDQTEMRNPPTLVVALVEEGVRLREAGIKAPILILGGAYGTAHRDVVAYRLTPVVSACADVVQFAAAAGDAAIELHLNVDTGMGRLGVPTEQLTSLFESCRDQPNVRIGGIMTHFASAAIDLDYTRGQLQRFTEALGTWRAVYSRVDDHAFDTPIVHAANSAATFLWPAARFDAVRCGLALYGYGPNRAYPAPLRPALRWVSQVAHVRRVPVGGRVGYEGTFCATRDSRIATVPVGYGDGLSRALSNRGAMLVQGQRCPIVGTISMDLTTIDVTDVPAAVGDRVILIGSQGCESQSAWELAEASGTIPYEVLTSISSRVPRRLLPRLRDDC